MMNYKNLWKLTLSSALLVALVLPAAGLANPKTHVSPKAASDKKDVLAKYSQLAGKYLSDCEGLTEQVRPAGDRLKRCLTIAKELQDKLLEFVATLDTIVKNAKGAKRWTPELDQRFDRDAAKSGLDAETINLIRQSGGFRAFYEKSLGELRSSKVEADREIKVLETKIKETASASQGVFFQTASFEPAGEYSRGKKWEILLKVAKEVVKVIIAVCTNTDLCS